MRIALLTAKATAKTDFDLPPLIAAFQRAGVVAEVLAWDDPHADPEAFDVCVLRSTWDYYHMPQRFLSWLEHAATTTRLLNPLAVVRWNIDKRYLLELQAGGVPVIPTEFALRGSTADLDDILRARGWSDVVIKPAISAGSFMTRRCAPDEAAAGAAFLAESCRTRDMMVQPYMRSVGEGGERSQVWIDGEITHVVRKRPRFAGHEEFVVAAEPPTDDERALASAAISRWRDQLLYARIDTIRDDDGRVRLSELELIEPSLFFDMGSGAAQRFVAAVLRR